MAKQYILLTEDNAGYLIEEEELQTWLTDGSIEEGDHIYEVNSVYIAKKTTSIYPEALTPNQ